MRNISILQIENITNPDQFTERLKSGKYNGFLTSVMENDRLLFFPMRTNIPVTYSKRNELN